jgi:aminobenzoyl-glutamate utilization protein B
MAHAANQMREHVKPTARIHYVFPSAGEAPNVVPSYAKMWFFVRDSSRPQVEESYAWMQKIAEGSALATRTTYKVFLNTGVYEYLFNRPLQEAMQKNLEVVGAPQWTEADQQFARAMQKVSGREEKGLSTTVKPLAPTVQPMEGGSTDVADVSWINPTVGLEVATAGRDLPWHSWQTAASHGIPGASKASDVAAKVIAMTAVDLLTDPKLLAAARADFAKKTAGRPYRSAIPEGQKPPLP